MRRNRYGDPPLTLGAAAAAGVRLSYGARHARIRSSPTPRRWLLGTAPKRGVLASRLRKKSRVRKDGREMRSMPDYGHIRSMGYGRAPVGESQRNDDQSTFSQPARKERLVYLQCRSREIDRVLTGTKRR